MRDHRFYHYIAWGLTAVAVIASSIVFGLLLVNLDKVRASAGMLASILSPVIYGAVLAYLLAPVFNACVKKSEVFFVKIFKQEKISRGSAKALATLVSLLFIFAIVTGLISMLLPQLVTSIKGIVDSLPVNMENLSMWLEKTLADNPPVEARVLALYDKMAENVKLWMSKDLVPNLEIVISNVSNGLISAIVLLKNLLIGLIVMVYLLNIKDLFTAQSKKIIYGCFKLKLANQIIAEFRLIHQVFGGFIIGKMLDSFIIGILCFVCLNIMNMPYTLLISVIIGVTNVVPFFGPFIGAIPSAFLILLISPMKCVYFLVFILLLQQFDGNILGPKILGDSTGLSSFWVLFSILLFGGMFGFVGMIIGVPTFAVIYDLFSKRIKQQLRKKQLSTETSDYMDLNRIDEEKKTYIK